MSRVGKARPARASNRVIGCSYAVRMADRTSIEWTEATWNPTTGCDKISAGCENCYALTLAKRLKAMGNPKYQCDGDSRTSGPGFGLTVHPRALDLPKRWRQPRTVFVNSMSDLWHARVPSGFISDVFDVMAETPQHTYQLLTKRPRRLARMAQSLPWPKNVWMGVSVENQEQVWRIDELRKVPAAVRFISAEPLLGPLDADLTGVCCHRGRRIRAKSQKVRKRMGSRSTGSVRSCRNRVFLQAVGWNSRQAGWQGAGWTHVGRIARSKAR